MTTRNEKVKYVVFSKNTGLAKATKLEEQKRITANWHTMTKYLSDIFQEVNVWGVMLYHNNTSSYTAQLTVLS